jgi:choline-sulfatase
VRNALAFLDGQARQLEKPWVMYMGIEQPKAWGSGGIQKYLDMYPPEKMPLPNIPPGHLEQMHEAFQVLRNFHMISFPIADDRVRRARSAYYARVTEADAYLGSVLDLLEKSGRLENTYIIYTADHGEMLGEHGLWFKNELLEAAARIPLIIAGPGLERGKVVDTPVAHVDLVAGLLEAGGATIAAELRGHSLLPLAQGKQGGHPGWALSQSNSHGNCTGSYMVRRGDWKYVHFTSYESLLFNLRDDPDELVNLANKPAHASLRKELHAILTSQLDPDAVTRQAFREQERRLAELVKRQTAKEFYQDMAKRLGKGQAAVLTDRYYNT